jgi:uncharacterized membrane protein YraQ (UPF0718 family)
VFAGLLPYVAAGVLVGALLEVSVPAESIGGGRSGALAVPFAALAAVPLYVCSCAEVPVALSLLRKGLDPSAVLAFLLAGPGVSAFSVAMLSSLLRPRALAAYVFGFLAGSVALGFLWKGVFG